MIEPTECDDLLRLTDRQEAAIEHLLSGKNDTATAAAIGIHRTTIARWRAFHPAFQSEIARRRAELFASAADRLRSLLPKALDILECQFNFGRDNVPLAQAVVKMAGLDRLAPPSPEVDGAEEILLKLMDRRMAEIVSEREQRMTIDERLQAMNTATSYQDQLKMLSEALADVKSELRSKLSGDQTSGLGSKLEHDDVALRLTNRVDVKEQKATDSCPIHAIDL